MNVTAHATVRMWSDRFKRLRAAWSDGESKARDRKPRVSLFTHRVMLIVLVASYFIWKYVYITSSSEILIGWQELLKMALIVTVLSDLSYVLAKPVAKWTDSDDNGITSIVLWIVFILVGLLTILAAMDSYRDRPVTQVIYDQHKILNPDCARLNDYRHARAEKQEILKIGDLRQALRECSQNRSKTNILDQQKSLK